VVENISKMFITGPNVIKTVLGEDISMEDLGGAAYMPKLQVMPIFMHRASLNVLTKSRNW
jgi:Acetyl-CoA carboxylase, carboxyltransferase component (subunits alpha and beta)